MKYKKEKLCKARLDNYEWQMLDELTKKFETDKSKLIRALIIREYEKQFN